MILGFRQNKTKTKQNKTKGFILFEFDFDFDFDFWNKRQLIFKTYFIVVLFYLVSILPILAVKRPNPTQSWDS